MRRPYAFWRSDESGSALVEFGLLMPVLTGIFLGAVGLSFGISEGMIVSQAATAGAMYGTLAGNNCDTAGMQNAATAAAGNLNGFQVQAQLCATNTMGATLSCPATCGASSNYEYVQVQTSATVPLLAHFPGLASTATLKGQSIMRVH